MMSSAFNLSVHVCLFLCLLVVTVKSHTTACNHGNATTCLYGNATYQGVQMLMSNSEKFWFGQDYPTNCPSNNSHTVHCHNPAPSYYSIITRMRMSDDDDTSGIEQVLGVHYGVPEGTYMTCGSQISMPTVDKMVDPVHTIYTDSWALNHRPHIMWEAETGVRYTLAFWDAGWFQLSGLWINIIGGRVEDGEEVLRYGGPLNPTTRRSMAVFLLFRQSQELTVSAVYDIVNKLTCWSGMVHMIHMNQLISDLGLIGPMAVSCIKTKVDVYSAHHGRQAGIINNCPYMRTKFMMSNEENLPLNVTAVHLTVTVDVSFDSPEIMFESCCHQHKIPKRTIHVDSRAPDILEPVYTRQQPRVTLQQTDLRDDPYFFEHPDRRFTLLLLDVTDATVNDTDKVVVHWQVINIQDAKLQTGDTTLAYMGVHVPVTSPERRFAFMLLEQSFALTRQSVEGFRVTNCQPMNRCHFDLRRFLKDLNLKLVGLSAFRSAVDPYSRRHMYTEGGHPKSAACVGVSGYSDPCPSDQTPTCSAAVVSLTPLCGLVLSVVVSLRAKF